jgi:hypothetical protein
MGTRSKTNVLDHKGNIIISIYRQMDGDIEHHGQDLKNFLKKNKMAKRINEATKCPEYQNGMEDLAGELFCFLKTRTKSVMPAHPATNDEWAFEYEIGFFEGGYAGSISGLYIKCRNWDTDWKFI